MWGFDGVVLSDWGGTHNTNEAIFNGLDIEMGTPSDKNISIRYPHQNNFLGKPFLEKIISGEVDERILNDKVRRILRLMFRTSLNKTRTFGKSRSYEWRFAKEISNTNEKHAKYDVCEKY